MPYVSNDLEVAETRVRELRAKIKLRKSQETLETNSATSFGRFPVHLQNLYKELAAAAAVVIAARFDPLEVLDRMGWK